MPRGGHRGGIFPVSGLPWGMNGTYKKRGLYHTKREDIFTPRWGFRFRNTNKSPYPDGSSKSFDVHTQFAWPLPDFRVHSIVYAHNEQRYLLPACMAKSQKIKEYILNILEPSHRRTFSGIGLPNVWGKYTLTDEHEINENEVQRNLFEIHRKLNIIPKHIYNISKEFRDDVNIQDLAHGCFDKIPVFKRGRIKKLYNLIVESDVWRNYDSIQHSKQQGRNVFPNVDEGAAIVRDLPLSEVLYARSNHRLRVRRHPIWLSNIYKKKKVTIPYLYRRRVAREEAQKRELGMWRGKTYVE